MDWAWKFLFCMKQLYCFIQIVWYSENKLLLWYIENQGMIRAGNQWIFRNKILHFPLSFYAVLPLFHIQTLIFSVSSVSWKCRTATQHTKTKCRKIYDFLHNYISYWIVFCAFIVTIINFFPIMIDENWSFLLQKLHQSINPSYFISLWFCTQKTL